MKKLVLAVVGLAVAFSALADLSKYKDWDKSPEAYFLTGSERTEWKSVATDEDAEKFIALYYARRGGDAFKQEISRRIAAADQQFKLRRYKRGADSVRGHLLVVLGAPSRVSQQRSQEGAVDDTGGVTAPAIDTRPGDASAGILYTWTYDKTKFDPSWGIPELKAVILVEEASTGSDTLRNGGIVEKAMATVAEKSIVNPNPTAAAAAAPAAKAAPAPAAGAPAAPAAAPAPAPVAAAVPLPAAVKASLDAAAGKGGEDAGFWAGTFRSAAGDAFLALQFYLPTNKPAFASAGPMKFGGIVTDDAGKEVASYWEDASFTDVAEGSRKDRVFDRSVTLPPGSYKGSFGLFASDSQPPAASSTVSFKLDPKTTDFGVSPLILSAGLVPLTKRPGPADPFVFGVEKPIKVEPKGDHTFLKQDSLWYFYGVENPAAAADAAAAAPAAEATPAAGAAPAAPAPAKPRVMTRINVQKDGQDAFAPFTGPADLVLTGPNFYSTGSEIPLASFEPGYYTFMITVRDLNAARGSVANKGLERKQDFVVLMPDGSMPPKKAPVTPAKKKS